MTAKVLLVDDEPNVLAAYRRELRGRFELLTASGGEEALARLEQDGPVAVVVSDMRMPGMDGAELLSHIKRGAPDTVRMMLTGCSDQETAIAAINRGRAQRFHNKPCPGDELARSIDDGIALHQRQVQLAAGLDQVMADSEELEQELRRARADAGAAERVIRTILSTVGHELRTPLNHVIGLSDLMRQGKLSEPSYREYAGYIFRSGSELHRKIENILCLSQIESGTLVPKREQIPLVRLVRQCIAHSGQAAEERAISIETQDSLPMLVGDEGLIGQALSHLISNAIKFTPVGGRVSVTVGLEEAGALALTVRDNGIGFEPASLPLAPFAQADSRLERAYEGLGIGLPLAKALIELHEGALSLESRPGVGTLAVVRFPPRRLTGLSHAIGIQEAHSSRRESQAEWNSTGRVLPLRAVGY